MNDTLVVNCKEIHNSIGIMTWEKPCLIYHHRLNHFPYKQEHFLQLRNPPLGDPIYTLPLQGVTCQLLNPSCKKLLSALFSTVYFCTS